MAGPRRPAAPLFYSAAGTALLVPGTGTVAVIDGTGPIANSVGPSLRSRDIICSQVVSFPVYAEIRALMAVRVDLAVFSASLIGLFVRMAVTRSTCSWS